MMREHTAHLRGLRLHYAEHGDHGDRSAPAALVLPGIMGHGREWDALAGALAADHRVIALDQRGHGRSDRADDYRVAAMAGDAIALIEALGLAPVRLIGHSLGALVALVTADRRPDLVSRLVLLDVGPDSLDLPWAVQELPAMLAAMGRASYASVDEAVAEWLSGNPLADERHLRHYVTHGSVPGADGRLRWRFDGAGLATWATRLIESTELWAVIDRITMPTLLVRGEHSPLLARPTAEQVVRRLADGRLVEIPDAGHDLGVEQPEAVTAAVRRFLGAGSVGPAAGQLPPGWASGASRNTALVQVNASA